MNNNTRNSIARHYAVLNQEQDSYELEIQNFFFPPEDHK